MAARAQNFLGFGKGSQKLSHSSRILDEAARAGARSGHGGSQPADEWFARAYPDERPTRAFRKRIHAAFDSAWEAAQRDSTRRTITSKTAPAARRSDYAYKGYRIYQSATDGAWKSSIDRDSEFDSEADVRRFIDAEAKRNPRRRPNGLEDLIAYTPVGQATGFLRTITGTRDKRKRNPEAESAAKFAEFHGEPSERVLVVEEQVHYHENLAVLADLAQLVAITPTGYRATFSFAGYDDKANDFDPNTPEAERPVLCVNETGNQLYFIGGDQDIDGALASFDMDNDEYIRDSMVIGPCVEITYQTAKGFDNFDLTAYFHHTAEDYGDHPLLIYDYLNKTLSWSGGNYHVGPEPEGGGGSIFN